jgi:hypothetical protein
VTDEGRVFNAADAVADAGWLKGLQGFPDTGGAGGFSRVGGAGYAVVDGVLEGGDVGVDGEAGFVSGDVESGDTGALKLMDEVGGLQALFLIEMAKGAEDQAGLDAGGLDALLGGSVYGGDYGFGGEAVEEMEEWGEAELGVEDAIAGQLVEDIFNHQAEGVFCLHELKAARSAG